MMARLSPVPGCLLHSRKLLLNLMWLVCGHAAAASQSYDDNATTQDAELGVRLGAGSAFTQHVVKPADPKSINFGGTATLLPSGILDLQTFIKQYKARELRQEIAEDIIAGAQKEVYTYLLTLAYSNPTIVSVVDMLDKRLSARQNALAQGRTASLNQLVNGQGTTQRQALAEDQCYSQSITQGQSPTEAYRNCSLQHNYSSVDIPASRSNEHYLSRYTTISLNNESRALMSLLPDQKIEGGGIAIRPPPLDVPTLSSNLKVRTRAALDAIENGGAPEKIASCGADDFLGNSSPASACIPPAAAALVAAPAFRSTRLLPPAARELYKDAVATQIATLATYSNLVELHQQLSRVDVKAGSGANAQEAEMRRRQMLSDTSALLVDADAQVKVQDAKLRLARSQFMAMQRAESELKNAADALAQPTQQDLGSQIIGIFLNQ